MCEREEERDCIVVLVNLDSQPDYNFMLYYVTDWLTIQCIYIVYRDYDNYVQVSQVSFFGAFFNLLK